MMRPLIRVGPVVVLRVLSPDATVFLVGRRDGEDSLHVVVTDEAVNEVSGQCAPMAGDVARVLAASIGHQVLYRRAIRAVRRGAA